MTGAIGRTRSQQRRTAAAGRIAIGADRVELHLRRISGVFGLLWVLQTGQAFAVDLPSTPGPFGAASASFVIASVLCGLAATVWPQRGRPFLYCAITLYLAASGLWLVALREPIPEAPYPYLPAVAVASLAYLAVACSRLVICIAAGIALCVSLDVAARRVRFSGVEGGEEFP